MSVKVNPLINILSTKGFADEKGAVSSFLDAHDLGMFARVCRAGNQIAKNCPTHILETHQQQFGCLTETEKKADLNTQNSPFVLYRTLEQIDTKARQIDYRNTPIPVNILTLDSLGNLEMRNVQEYLNEGNFLQRFCRKFSFYLGFQSRDLFEKCVNIWQSMKKVREDIANEVKHLKTLPYVNAGKEIWPRYRRLIALHKASHALDHAFDNHLWTIRSEIEKSNWIVKLIVKVVKTIFNAFLFIRSISKIQLFHDDLKNFGEVASSITETSYYSIGRIDQGTERVDVKINLSPSSPFRPPTITLLMVHNNETLAHVGVSTYWEGSDCTYELGNLRRKEVVVKWKQVEGDFFAPRNSTIHFHSDTCYPRALFNQQFITEKMAQIAIEILLRQPSSSMSLSTAVQSGAFRGSEFDSKTLEAKGFVISKSKDRTYLWKSSEKDKEGHFVLYRTKEMKEENRIWDEVLKNKPIIQIPGSFFLRLKDYEEFFNVKANPAHYNSF